jgi:hypothetical protein
MPKKNLIVLLSFFLAVFFISSKAAHAQDVSMSVAIATDLSGLNVTPGDIICKGENGFGLCQVEYDSSMFGVITENPAAYINDTTITDPSYLASSGVAKVRVTSQNGSISQGDDITTSDKPGIGQKASAGGYVIGMALEEYQSGDPGAVGEILVAINIHPASSIGARTNLIEALRQGIRAPIFDPLGSLRYLLAALIILISFVLGFVYFGRALGLGIEAIGRNPLASRKILFTVIVHILITIVIVVAGMFFAILILML